MVTPPDGWMNEPTIPVYAPADGEITAISTDWYPSFAPFGHDLALVIRVSTTMVVGYAHMSDFTPEIWAAAGELQVGYGATKDVSIAVNAGQIVGYIGTQGALDWYIGDSQLQLYFANRSRYPDPWLISGCYHDCYEEPLRSQLLAITAGTVEASLRQDRFRHAGPHHRQLVPGRRGAGVRVRRLQHPPRHRL